MSEPDNQARAEALVDEWERTEGESMREGHRATLERLIAEFAERVGGEALERAAKYMEGRKVTASEFYAKEIRSLKEGGSK